MYNLAVFEVIKVVTQCTIRWFVVTIMNYKGYTGERYKIRIVCSSGIIKKFKALKQLKT